MKHSETNYFLVPRATNQILDFALLNATTEGNLELIKVLVSNGASLETRSADSGSTPLDRAAYHGHYDVVSYFIEKGSNINHARPQTGITPLYIASENNHKVIVELLIKHGANVTFPIQRIV